jgi:hypothetical protein
LLNQVKLVYCPFGQSNMSSTLKFFPPSQEEKLRAYSRTATGMDGTLHTDFQKSKTSRDIKKYF